MSQIHPTAIIEPGAQLGERVSIGACAYIGPEVILGDDCVVHHHATIEGRTEMGPRNEVFPYALIGGKTHDLKYRGGRPGLRIGGDNVFREYVSVHLATHDEDFTVLGNHNHILAYSHVAHECIIGDHLVMSSHAALGGHVEVGNHVNVGWGVGIHQFVRLGDHCMVGACSKAVQDVPPFMLADGNPAVARFINKVGLERRGFSPEEISVARTAYKLLYKEGLNRSQALEKMQAHPEAQGRILQALIRFIEASERGLA